MKGDLKMSATTHPQFPSVGIPKMGDVVTMEITFWPHGKNREGICRTEKGFVVYQEAISGNECHIHLLNPFANLKTGRTLVREGKNWKCEWFGDMEHQVAVTWKPVVHF